MRFQTLGCSLLLLASLTLAACQHPEAASTPGGATPEAAVQQSVALLKTGDFVGFWQHALPPANYADLRADWLRQNPAQRPLSDQDRARFSFAIQQLTAPGAENKMYDQLQPKLAQMDEQYHDQLPVMIGIGQAILTNSIAQNTTLTESQKQQARDVLNALLPWAQQTPWFDQDKAKKAVGVMVTTTRQLDVKSADQLQHLDFDTSMKKYAVGYGGIKQLLAIYGLSVDDTLDSVKVSTLSETNGQARVKIDYTLLGKPLTTESQLVQVDGRWYSQDLINSEHAKHQQALHPAPAASLAAPASAATAPATAGSVKAPATLAKP